MLVTIAMENGGQLTRHIAHNLPLNENQKTVKKLNDNQIVGISNVDNLYRKKTATKDRQIHC